jgi:hypothetical protein
MRLERSCLTDIFSRRVNLRTRNLHSGRLKKRLWCSRWSDVWMCQKSIRAYFLQPPHGNKRLGWSRLSDVLFRTWRLIICFVNVLKCDFGDVDETMFHDVERTFERIFLLLGIQKRVLDEVAVLMFLVCEWPWEFIICILDVLKNYFVEFEEAMFQGVKKPLELNFCNMSIEKKGLGWIRLSDVLSRWKTLRSHNLHSVCLKKRLRGIRWSGFQVSKFHTNSFSAA